MNPVYDSLLNSCFSPAALLAAKAHARQVFPLESCGYIAAGAYVPCENTSSKPLEEFEINDEGYARALSSGTLQAVVHSHPNGPIFPSEKDMRQQLVSDVPWIIVSLNDDHHGHMVAWGDSLPIVPVIGRPFCHGVFDCFSNLRDAMRLGKDGLAKEGVSWPLPPADLPQVPRDDCWWTKGENLYLDYLEKVGFRQISMSEAQPGDGYLMALGDRGVNPHKRLNHAGLLTGNDLILHHLPMRLSTRAPAGLWWRGADMWVRYEGAFREA